MKRDNFYILLGLSPQPPVEDAAVIRQALAAKKQEWTRMQDNPSTRSRALKYLGLAEEMEAVMLNPQQRRKEAQEAVVLQEQAMRDFAAELRIPEGKGYLLPREAEDLARKYAAFGLTPQKVEEQARVPIAEKAPPQKQEENDRPPVISRLTAKNLERNLETVGKKNLYDFLGLPGYSSIKKLREAAEEARRSAAAAGKRSAQQTAVQELAGACLQLFQDFSSKTGYDRYVKISGYPELSDLIHEEFIRSRLISNSALLRLINFAVEKYAIGVLQAESYVRDYCAAYSIAVGTPEGERIVCPECAAGNDSDARLCSKCGTALRKECPICGTASGADAAVCKECGFRVGAMQNALPHLEQAKEALADKRWASAGRSLEYARKFWPGHRELESIAQKIKALSDDYRCFADSVDECLKKGRFYAAREMLEKGKEEGHHLPASREEHILRVISRLEQQLEQAEQQGSITPQFLLELAQQVTDSLEINRLLRGYPPEPPGTLLCEQKESSLHLSWQPSCAVGEILYHVVRREGQPPRSPADGDVVYLGAASQFVDKEPKRLTSYYYGVFAQRLETFSNACAVGGPFAAVPELKELTLLPAEGSVHINWQFDPDLRAVRIWRKLGGDRPTRPGDGLELENKRLDGFSDSRVKNGVDYWYYVVACYGVANQQFESRGLCRSVTPAPQLAPVEQLAVVPAREAEYVAAWEDSIGFDVILLCTPKQPQWRMGQLVPMEQLLGSCRKLDFLARHAAGGRFGLNFTGGMHVLAASVSGRYATVGSCVYLTHVPPVQAPSWDRDSEEIYLNMRWPAGIKEVAVAYRLDRYPKAVGENGSVVIRCTKEEYESNAGVLLRQPEPGIYYFRIFTVFRSEDGTEHFGQGVPLLMDNRPPQEIFYEVKYQKNLLGSKGKLLLTMKCREIKKAPKVVLVGKLGQPPTKKTDGMPLLTLDEAKREMGVTHRFETSPLPGNLYVKLFFLDDADYDNCRLIPENDCHLTQ